MISAHIIEERFKKNLINNVFELLASYIQEAIERKILTDLKANIINGVLPQVKSYLEEKAGSELIEGFIKCSRSADDFEDKGGSYKLRKYPEYWEIFSLLPTFEEYSREKNLPENECIPLPLQVEEFFVSNLETIFPIMKNISDVISFLYAYRDNLGRPFLSLSEKKFIGVNFRSFPILAIKYINIRRNPKIENGKLVLNPETKNIIFTFDYMADLSIRKSMQKFNLTMDDLLK